MVDCEFLDEEVRAVYFEDLSPKWLRGRSWIHFSGEYPSSLKNRGFAISSEPNSLDKRRDPHTNIDEIGRVWLEEEQDKKTRTYWTKKGGTRGKWKLVLLRWMPWQTPDSYFDGDIRKLKTHCVYGHEFTPANTATTRRGRVCRECKRRYTREAMRKSRKIRAGGIDADALDQRHENRQ